MVGSENNTIGFEKNGESTVQTLHHVYNIFWWLVGRLYVVNNIIVATAPRLSRDMHFGRTIFRLFIFFSQRRKCFRRFTGTTIHKRVVQERRDIAAHNDYKVRAVTVLRQRVRLKSILVRYSVYSFRVYIIRVKKRDALGKRDDQFFLRCLDDL